MKSCKVCITTKSTLASLLFKGLATKHTTVKWTVVAQVDCLQQLCILGDKITTDNYVTKFSPRRANQWWRLVTSLYLHQGILDYLLITCVQIWLCWRQEIILGWLRMALVYHTAGVGGHLVRHMPYTLYVIIINVSTTPSCVKRKVKLPNLSLKYDYNLVFIFD